MLTPQGGWRTTTELAKFYISYPFSFPTILPNDFEITIFLQENSGLATVEK
jgi:hypothetical protein